MITTSDWHEAGWLAGMGEAEMGYPESPEDAEIMIPVERHYDAFIEGWDEAMIYLKKQRILNDDQ